MELKTDKIHHILNTPYDELRPQDFDAAQGQLDILIVEARDKQLDAFRFLENKLVCERDAALKRVSELTAQLFILQQKPVALDLMAERDAARVERDQLAQTATANAETLRMTKREHAVTVENLETALAGTKAERDQFKGICARLKRELEEANRETKQAWLSYERVQIQRDEAKEHAPRFESQANSLLEERDRLSAELDDERQKPSGTAKQAERIRELETKLASRIDPAYHAKLAAELEQAKAQAANAQAMVYGITAERDAAHERELRALRQLADLVERTSKPTIYEYDALGDLARMRDLAKLSRAGGTLGVEVPPCERCGRKREQAAVDVGDPLCAACADRVVKEATGEHLATSTDGGQSWWCPRCQASIVPDVPHVCP